MAVSKPVLPQKVTVDTVRDKDSKKYAVSTEKPPSRWWGNPFYKGFMYTGGVALAILTASMIATIISHVWPSFERFSRLGESD